jgi:hypothetical protein
VNTFGSSLIVVKLAAQFTEEAGDWYDITCAVLINIRVRRHYLNGVERFGRWCRFLQGWGTGSLIIKTNYYSLVPANYSTQTWTLSMLHHFYYLIL